MQLKSIISIINNQAPLAKILKTFNFYKCI